MIRKDYLLRQLNQLLEGIAQKFLNIKNGIEEYEPDEISDLYQKYFQRDKEFFLNNSLDKIVNYLENDNTPDEVLARLQILSELLLGEGVLVNDKKLLQKARQTLLYIDDQSKIFNLDIKIKISQLNKILE